MEIRQHPFFSKIIDLTLAVYRVTSFFPRGEALRDQIRAKANSILAHTVKVFYLASSKIDPQEKHVSEEDFFSEVDILRGYFSVAKYQGWVKEANFEVLESAYKGIKQEFKEYFMDRSTGKGDTRGGSEGVKTRPPSIDNGNKIEYNISTLPTRQKKIFEYVKKNGKTQAVDLEPVLEGVNIRTIRRDLEGLAESGFLNREVKGRQIFFWTKKTQVA
jgi:hypothetical protein